MKMPPVELSGRATTDSLHFRRTTLSGVFDFDRQVIVVARSLQGVPGVHVVTPLKLDDGTAVLVERGWAPSPDGRSVELDEYSQVPDSAGVEGVLRQTEPDDRMVWDDGWPLYVLFANPEQMEHHFPYSLIPLVLRRTSEPHVATSRLRLVPLPEFTNGPHLSYAVQWFTFGLIALVGGGILFLRGNRERGTEKRIVPHP